MKNFLLFIVIAALAGLAVYFAMRSPQGQVAKDKLTSDKPMDEAEIQKQLTVYKMRRQKLVEKVTLMENSRDETRAYLRDNGIRQKSDTDGKPEARMAYQNLASLVAGIKQLEGDKKKVDSVIARMEAILLKMERERISKSVGLTEEEQIDLRAMEMELNDKLDIDEKDIFGDEEKEVEDLLKPENGAGSSNGVELELDDVLN